MFIRNILEIWNIYKNIIHINLCWFNFCYVIGIRSLSFQDNVITIGTGVGVIMFYDIRAGKYLESSINSSRAVVLKTSRGYVVSNIIYNSHIIWYFITFFSVPWWRFHGGPRISTSQIYTSNLYTLLWLFRNKIIFCRWTVTSKFMWQLCRFMAIIFLQFIV